MIKIDNIKKANQVKIETIIKALEKRGMKGYYAENGEEALKMVLEMMPEGSSVGRGGSETLNQLGVFDELHKRNYTCYEPHSEPDPEKAVAIRRAIFSANFLLTSANAITMDGEIVNIDGTGNRLAPIIYGPDKVIFIVGSNKIAANVHAAYDRIRCEACPPNCIRLGKKTPCAATGVCADCDSPDRICKVTAIFDRPPTGTPTKVIVVDEDLGY